MVACCGTPRRHCGAAIAATVAACLLLLGTTCAGYSLTDLVAAATMDKATGTACAPGYIRMADTQRCSPCQGGTYHDATANACVACAEGQYQDLEAQTSCQACNPGTRSEANATSCSACPPGTYSKPGSRACMPCHPGTFNKLLAQGQCTSATAGSFATGSGNKAQTPCPRGSYQDSTGKATCIKCPINTYQALPGKTTCHTCCMAGTVLGKTCFLWTRGLQGQAKCISARTRPGSKLL